MFQIMVISVPRLMAAIAWLQRFELVHGFGDAQFLHEQLHPGKRVLGTAVG